MYAIQDNESKKYLSSINITTCGRNRKTGWVKDPDGAIYFNNPDEAIETIDFIVNIIDWELEDQIEVVKI